MTIGFTNDGMVFLTETSTSPNGRPAQITLTWTPEDALKIADLIKQSVVRWKEKQSGLILPGVHL